MPPLTRVKRSLSEVEGHDEDCRSLAPFKKRKRPIRHFGVLLVNPIDAVYLQAFLEHANYDGTLTVIGAECSWKHAIIAEPIHRGSMHGLVERVKMMRCINCAELPSWYGRSYGEAIAEASALTRALAVPVLWVSPEQLFSRAGVVLPSEYVRFLTLPRIERGRKLQRALRVALDAALPPELQDIVLGYTHDISAFDPEADRCVEVGQEAACLLPDLVGRCLPEQDAAWVARHHRLFGYRFAKDYDMAVVHVHEQSGLASWSHVREECRPRARRLLCALEILEGVPPGTLLPLSEDKKQEEEEQFPCFTLVERETNVQKRANFAYTLRICYVAMLVEESRTQLAKVVFSCTPTLYFNINNVVFADTVQAAQASSRVAGNQDTEDMYYLRDERRFAIICFNKSKQAFEESPFTRCKRTPFSGGAYFSRIKFSKSN